MRPTSRSAAASSFWRGYAASLRRSWLGRMVQHLDLGEEDVWFIHRRVRDPTRNGAWVGFASGAAAGLWYLHGFCFSGSDSCTPQPRVKDFALIGSFFGAVGAWLGVGLDGLLAREEELWPQTPSRA